MHDYDSMIQSYEICQKEHETVEEYMLRAHEAVAVVKHAYPDQVPNEGEGLRQDCFYNRLMPSIRDALSFVMADLSETEQTPDLTLSIIWPRNWRRVTNHITRPKVELWPMTPTRVTRSIPPPENVQLLSKQICSHRILNGWKVHHPNQTT